MRDNIRPFPGAQADFFRCCENDENCTSPCPAHPWYNGGIKSRSAPPRMSEVPEGEVLPDDDNTPAWQLALAASAVWIVIGVAIWAALH